MEPAKSVPDWVVDLEDPRAPPTEIWEALTPEQRQRVVDSLPSEFEPVEAMPPEGDFHDEEGSNLKRGLRRFFSGGKRQVYVAGNLPVYYPGRHLFAPDLIAVVDAAPHFRDSWIVSKEDKGLSVAVELIWSGRRRKDLVMNVERYAGLKIPEYFVFDMPRKMLLGYRLPADLPDDATDVEYHPIEEDMGRLHCEQLGLDLAVENGHLRFYHSTAIIPRFDEVLEKTEGVLRESVSRIRELEAALDQEQEARVQAEHARMQAEHALAEARAELEALRKKTH